MTRLRKMMLEEPLPRQARASWADQCRTGSVSAEQDSMPCWGIVRTRSTSSPYTVFDWLIHGYTSQGDSPAILFHDPNGAGDLSDVGLAGFFLDASYRRAAAP